MKFNLPEIFSNPWYGFIVSIITILSLLLSVYAIFFQNSPKRELTYYVDPVKTIIFNSEQSSKLGVVIDEKVVTADVSAIQIAVWNAGNVPIRRENILSQVKIRAVPSIRILEVIEKKVNRTKKITGLSISETNFDEGLIDLDWIILEKNDGALLQINYLGDTNVKFDLVGVIEGQTNVEAPSIFGSVRTPREQFEDSKKSSQIIGFVALAYGLIILIIFPLLKRLKKKVNEKLKDSTKYPTISVKKLEFFNILLIPVNRFSTTLYVFGIVLLIFGIYWIITTSTVEPPFGF